MDPNTWKNGVSRDAWSIFDPSVADQAKKDSKNLTLGDQVPDLTKLSLKESSLAVKVLEDAAGKPLAAVAHVDFAGSGTLHNGQTVDVTNHADFLLRLEGGKWLVIGYPIASTDIENAAGAATASPTPTASP